MLSQELSNFQQIEFENRNAIYHSFVPKFFLVPVYKDLRVLLFYDMTKQNADEIVY